MAGSIDEGGDEGGAVNLSTDNNVVTSMQMEMAVMVMSMKKNMVIVLLEIKVVQKETT